MNEYTIAFINDATGYVKWLTVKADKFPDAVAKAETMLDDPAGYSFGGWM